MPRATDRGRLIAAAAAMVAVVALLVWGLVARGDSTSSEDRASAATGQTTPSPRTTTPSATKSAAPTITPSSPPTTRTKAPTFGPSTTKPQGNPARVVVVSTTGKTLVDASLVPSHLDGKGVLAPPFGVAGWYAEPGWAKPGWPGASILAGHINRRSPKIELDTFGHLTQVRAGDKITVVYSSGQSTSFTTTKSKALSKKAVPKDDSIWDSGNPQPVLRLITCDPTTPVQGGHYEGNWVVWANLA